MAFTQLCLASVRAAVDNSKHKVGVTVFNKALFTKTSGGLHLVHWL